MHEMSIAQSLLQMAEDEMTRSGCTRLEKIWVTLGAICGVEPESLKVCFDILVRDTAYAEAKLHIIKLPLRLRCSSCGNIFGGEGQDALWMPCPACGEQLGHVVEQGRELLLNRLEAR
ncbi:MAG: hydrogenase maturation nickel metallochaperone HypA [Desulfovibrio sp.]|nr:hydrogenase maturation nickel metallochaperone HypA [Desulfovibrio sp.]